MKRFLRFASLVAFLGAAWIAIPMLVGRDKEPERRLVGALTFIENTIQNSRSVPIEVDVFNTPSIEQEPESNLWSISAELTILVSTGTVIREPYTAVVENQCQNFAEQKCWRLIQLTIGGTVLGGEAESIGLELEKLAPEIAVGKNRMAFEKKVRG